MVAGRCCRGQRRSRVLRAAGIGGIVWRAESLGRMEVLRIDVLREIQYGARVAPYSPSQFHAEGFITHDTAYSSPLSARSRFTMRPLSRILTSRETWEGFLFSVSFGFIPFV